MQVWNVLHVARWKYSTRKIAKKSRSGHHPTTLSGWIIATKACIDNWKKSLLSISISSTCPHNMVNFGPLAAEIFWRVWGTPANFNRFCVLAALLQGIPVLGVSQTAALNRGRHLYLAGRPSRWALAHILVYCFFLLPFVFSYSIYLSSSFDHPFPFYQNSPTPFPGRRSQEATKPWFSFVCVICIC